MSHPIIKYKSLYQEKNYLKELAGSMFSRFGDGVDTIAFSMLIYQITGSTLLTATVFAVNGLPNLLFGLISGAVTRHRNEKNIMALCDFGRGLCVAAVALLYFAGLLRPWHLYVFTFLNSSFEAFRGPAAVSIVPRILSKEKLEEGVALEASATKLMEMLGLAAAPILVGTIQLGGAILVDAATFLVCGICSALIRVPRVKKGKITLKGGFTDLKEGFVHVKGSAELVRICVFTCLINIVFVPVNVFQVPYVENILHEGSSMLSVIGIASIAGMSATALCAPAVKERIGERRAFLYSGLLIGAAYLTMIGIADAPVWLKYPVLFLALFLYGGGIAVSSFLIQTKVFAVVEQEYLSRVSAIMNMFALCIVPIASAAVGVVSEAVRLDLLFIGAGVFAAAVYLGDYVISGKRTLWKESGQSQD